MILYPKICILCVYYMLYLREGELNIYQKWCGVNCSKQVCSLVDLHMSHPRPSTKTRQNGKVNEVRSSKKVCAERLACKGKELLSAYYFCEDCGSTQCQSCDSLLHQKPVLALHTRVVVSPPRVEELCHGDCENKNFADLSCEKCKVNLCYECDLKIHRRGKQTHIREKFESSKIFDDEEFLSCEYNISPLSNHFGSRKSVNDADIDFSNSSEVTNEPEEYHSLLNSATDTERNVTKQAMKDQTECAKRALIINDEGLQVDDPSAFSSYLDCEQNDVVKVLSVIGNTGDGKSFTLNNLFFNDAVFETSPLPEACTRGVWAAYSHEHEVIVFDTQGFCNSVGDLNDNGKLLLKISAISDVVIYNTSWDHLHYGFSFLGDLSLAYLKYIQQHEIEKDPMNIKKPILIVTFEGQNIDKHDINPEAFHQVHFVELKDIAGVPDFSALKHVIKDCWCSKSRYRKVSSIFNTLKLIHNNYNEEVNLSMYIKCKAHCLCCGCRCSLAANHVDENIPHDSSVECTIKKTHKNYVRYCKICFEKGQKIKVVEKKCSSNEWTRWISSKLYGEVLDCSSCGIIGQNGDGDSLKKFVILPYHIWCKDEAQVEESHIARNIIDNISYVSENVNILRVKVTKPLTEWATSKVAPEYWVENSEILYCGICKKKFELLDSKHHCRICGGGFCFRCSSNFRFIPKFNGKQRVCDNCKKSDIPRLDNVDITARKATEAVASGLEYASMIGNFTLGLIKEAAKPSYWVPDYAICNCKLCGVAFSSNVHIHHCRACGQGVCNECSLTRRPVPSRGWKDDVRVCNECKTKVSL